MSYIYIYIYIYDISSLRVNCLLENEGLPKCYVLLTVPMFVDISE